nr:efflux RND transporter periplasmic adaptor subunit [Bacteroides sp.]
MKLSKAAFILITAASLSTCGHSEADGHDHHDGHETHEHGHDHDHDHDHDGHGKAEEKSHDGLIEFSDAEAARFDVVLDIPRQGDIAETVTLPATVVGTSDAQTILTAPRSGRLSLPASVREGNRVSRGQTVASVSAQGVTGGDTDAAAKARLAVVEAEIQRVTPLVNEGIVTRKDFNALMAEAAELRKLASTASGSGSVTAPASGVIASVMAANGAYVNAGDPIVKILGAETSSAMLRVDVPRRLASQLGAMSAASVTTPDGRRLSLPRHTTAAATDASGYITAYFGPVSSPALVPGSAVEASVTIGSDVKPLIVPQACLNEQEGVYSLFVKVSPGHYRRVPVEIGNSDGRNVEIRSGVSAADSVVTAGAVFIRLAETRANAPQGHTHNH